MTPAITLVSSQDLRAHLSRFLQRARQGERITVTVHGRPVAVLGPVGDDGPRTYTHGTLEDLAGVLGEEQEVECPRCDEGDEHWVGRGCPRCDPPVREVV